MARRHIKRQQDSSVCKSTCQRTQVSSRNIHKEANYCDMGGGSLNKIKILKQFFKKKLLLARHDEVPVTPALGRVKMQEGLVQCISLLLSEFETRLGYTMHYLKTKQKKNASVQKEKWVTGKEKKGQE